MTVLKSKLKNAQIKFADFWTKTTDRDLSKQEVRITTKKRKMVEPAANDDLLKGIYKGSAQEINLSSYFATGMVDVPRNMTGIPGIIPDQGQDDKLIKEIMPLVMDEFPVLVCTMLVNGTAWRWAKWSDKLHRLVWEAIPDGSITSIIYDLDTGEISELWIDEQIEYNKDKTNIDYTNRIRHITRTMITEEWRGGSNNKIIQYKNPFGFMPVPFGHNCFEGEWRGNSVFGKVLRHLKTSHDIEYKRDEILSDFDPKIIQQVKDVGTWVKNNTPPGTDPKSVQFDPFGHRFFVNLEGETTTFAALTADATSQHTVALKDKELKIIKGSGVPELFFGALATGNHASTDTDKLLVLDYIGGLRRELTKATQDIVNQSLMILAYMRFTQPPQVSIQWGNMSMLSEMEKAQVMGAYSSAIVPLMNNGAISPEGAFWLTKKLYPEFPAEDAEHFMSGMDKMIVDHASKIGQPAFDTGGMGAF